MMEQEEILSVNNVGAEVAIPFMVVLIQSNSKKNGRIGGLGGSTEIRILNGGKPCNAEITTRGNANVTGNNDWIMKSGYG
jgi:hypothetical protein